MSDYIQDALDARDVHQFIVGASNAHWLGPEVKLVGFSHGKRDYKIILQDDELISTFWGSIAKAREKIAERKPEGG